MNESIDKKKVKITEHAIKKYWIETKREGKIDISNLEGEIRNLFEESKREKMNAGLVTRIMNNNFEPTAFFKKGKWRFVICNNTMVTIERDRFDDSSIGYIKKKNLNKRK